MKLNKIAICLVLATASSSVFAVQLNDNDDGIKIRLQTDFRDAVKPSAGKSGNDIYAFVEGGLIDFNTHYYNDMIGVEGGTYYVKRIDADSDQSTRFYLNGTDSFGFSLGALKLQLTPDVKFKLGRFGTDANYGSLPYKIPLIDETSQRTLPTVSQGALGYFAVSDSFDIWTMWREKVFTWADSASGVHDEGVTSSITYQIIKKKPRNFIAGSWHNDSSRYSLGVSYQDDVSTQYEMNIEKTFNKNSTHFVKSQFLAFYGEINGLSKNISAPNSTQLYTGQITYGMPWGNFFGAAEHNQHALSATAINTDIGYPFSLSIDRNKEDMWSFQMGTNYTINRQWSVMLSPFMTNGYESWTKKVPINGYGVLLGTNYRVMDGSLKGLNLFFATDRAHESREGSSLGDSLKYWDVKMIARYDFLIK